MPVGREEVSARLELRHKVRVELELVDTSTLITEFTFDPDKAEVITSINSDVIAGIVMAGYGIIDASRIDSVVGVVEIHILDEHYTAFDTDVRGLVFGQGR